MKQLFLTMACLAACGSAFAQPVISSGGIANSASYAYSGLPNAAIAQGSLFVVFGSGMGPAALQQATTYPLSTMLAGTSLTATVNGTATKPLMVYTSAGQVAAILPSATPVGTGTLTVTYNGQTSVTAPLQVAANSFGIYSINQAGSGLGIVTNTNYQVANLTTAAQPGEAYILWGTGLGPVTGDESQGGSAVKLGTVPVEVYVGGKSAAILGYARSSCCAGLDQVAFTVPAGITGCHVPVVVKTGNIVSNYVSMPIATGTRTCSDNTGIDLTSVSQKGTVATGDIGLNQSNISVAASGLGTITSTSETAYGDFYKYTYSQYTTVQSPLDINTFGACTVYSFKGSTGTYTDPVVPTNLDAGASLTLVGPNGTKTLTKTQGTYGVTLSSITSIPGQTTTTGTPYLTKGTYTITAPGGADVGGFTATLNVPDVLNWTNASSTNTIPRTQDLLVTWTGGDPNGQVIITGTSITNTTASLGSAFVCIERASAGRFSVPSLVLLSLPASSTSTAAGSIGGIMAVSSGVSTTFKASGLDQGSFSSSASTAKTVSFQ